MSDIPREEHEEAPRARVHLAKWSPWVWIIPAIAIFFAGFLVVRYGFFGGGDITVRFADARGLDRYSPVRFRGAKVGSVQKITIDKNLRQVVVRISLDASMSHALNKGTHFWIVEPGLEGGGLGGLLSGTYVGIAPGEGDSTRDFTGQEYEPVLSPPEDGKTFVLEAHGLGSIAVGSPVQMKGVQVGHVRDVRLRYVPATGSLETPVAIEIDPRLLQLDVKNVTSREQLRAMMNDALGKMVQKGMRATLNTSLVLPGAGGVSLDFVAAPGTGRLVTTVDPPIIPAAPAGGGIDSALAALNDVAARIRKLPIEEIAGHLRSTTAQVDKLVHDPALSESLQRLNRAMADVEKITGTARENVGPIVESLRNAAASAQQAAARAQQMLASTPRQDYDLGNLVKELTRAAESVRGLADYLQENPDALLKGRGKGK